jgi:DNA-binding transcriptional regulator YiaG
MANRKQRPQYTWDAQAVRSLRQHMEFSQDELAQELGVRQQTVSEWELGAYTPRGASLRVLSMVAEESSFYDAAPQDKSAPDSTPESGHGS